MHNGVGTTRRRGNYVTTLLTSAASCRRELCCRWSLHRLFSIWFWAGILTAGRSSYLPPVPVLLPRSLHVPLLSRPVCPLLSLLVHLHLPLLLLLLLLQPDTTRWIQRPFRARRNVGPT